MAVLLPPPDDSGLIPNLGAGIVPPAPAQYNFASAAQAPPSQPAPMAPEEKPHYSILSRLLGDAHRDQVASKQALVNFYAQNIHAAYNDPNNRTPPEVLTQWGSEMGKLLGNPTAAKAIKADIDRHLASREASQKLQYMNQNQPTGLGTPVMPGQTPPAATPAQPAQPRPPASPVMGNATPQGPPGPPQLPIPFGNGDQAGAPAPQANIPAPVAKASVMGGMGFGGPSPRPAPTGLSPGIVSRAQLGTEQGQQDLNAKLPLAQAQADIAQRMQAALIQDAMKIGLTDPAMIADFVNKHAVSTPTSVAPGGQLYDRSGKLIASGGPRAIAQSPGGSTLLLPTSGGPAGTPAPAPTVIQGPPALLAPDQRAANAMWEKTHGLPTPPDKYGEAMSEYKEASMTASARQMQNIRVANLAELRKSRELQQAHLAQTIKEFNVTKGPEAIDSLADQVYANPDFYAKLTGDVANLTAQRFSAKYNLPPPRPLPADMRNKEDSSIISLNHIQAIKELLKNPAIQKRMGAWDGRVGTIEQAIGTTKGLSDKDARAIQDFRLRVAYLFGQETKSVFGGRPAAKLLDDIKAASPRMSMGLPLFEGGLDAMEGMGKLNIQSTDDYRFNKRQGGTAGAIPAPPEKTYTWQSGGRPMRGAIPKAEEAEFLTNHPEAKVAQ